MTCSEAPRVVEAEPSVLDGTDDSLLARHVATCAECTEIAGRILEGNRFLHATLDATGDLDVDALLARAAIQPDRVPFERRPFLRVAFLAAAALLAAFLLVRRGQPPVSDPAELASIGVRADAAYRGLDVRTESDLAILQTDNPDITVLWFFTGE
jgi:anti-sigma factor RsiW